MIFIFTKMKKYIYQVIFSLTIKGFGTIADLVLPFLLSFMIDDLIIKVTPQNHREIYLVGLLMLMIAVLGWFFNIVANRSAEKVASLSVADVRSELFYKIESLDAKQVDELTTSSLITRLTSDTYNIYSMIGSLQRLGIRAPMLLIGGIIMSSFMNLTLTLIMIALLPFIVYIVYRYTKKGQPLYLDIQEQNDNLIRTLRENITGVRVVRALSMTDYEKQRFQHENYSSVRKEIKATLSMNKIRPLTDIVMNIGLVVVLVVGAFQVVEGTMKVGQILALITYFTLILNAMTSITRIFIQISRAQASSKRIVEVLSKTNSMVDGVLDIVENNKPHIEFNDVYFSYHGKKDHLEKISFKLYKGQTLGILGSTGSGKTTIVNLIMRFYDPNQGEIKIFGEDIKSIKKKSLRSHIGLVQQNDLVFSESIEENIAFLRPDVDFEQVEFATEIAQADFIKEMPDQYNYKVAQRGTNISGGQKQRLLIARAIAGNPKILILDDASSALDYKTDSKLRGSLKQKMNKTTKIIVAQRVSSIKDADLILLIEDGRIVAKGSHDELNETSIHYKTLIKHQLGVDNNE